MRKIFGLLLVVLAGFSSTLYGQSATEKEVMQVIVESYSYGAKNLKERLSDYSQHGSLEFWSSGGLLQEVSPKGAIQEYELLNIEPKHIKVIALVEGRAAVALFYAEGSMKPKGLPAVDHYLVRVTQVFVNEDGKWKIRSSHFSPIAGGSGTTQAGRTPQP